MCQTQMCLKCPEWCLQLWRGPMGLLLAGSSRAWRHMLNEIDQWSTHVLDRYEILSQYGPGDAKLELPSHVQICHFWTHQVVYLNMLLVNNMQFDLSSPASLCVHKSSCSKFLTLNGWILRWRRFSHHLKFFRQPSGIESYPLSILTW